jgi:uncharacterized lipoprotein YajG
MQNTVKLLTALVAMAALSGCAVVSATTTVVGVGVSAATTVVGAGVSVGSAAVKAVVP